jgi:septal ring factor EnvC (AmiA/AmiB activator)
MNLERQSKTDVENTNRAGAEINQRLRDLERSRSQAQRDHNAKDQEVRRLQEQLKSVERQRRQDAERNSQQLADLMRSQATPPAAPSVGAFDMSALQKVVRDTQAHQLTAMDIERVIEEQVSKRLVGMATKQDI